MTPTADPDQHARHGVVGFEAVAQHHLARGVAQKQPPLLDEIGVARVEIQVGDGHELELVLADLSQQLPSEGGKPVAADLLEPNRDRIVGGVLSANLLTLVVLPAIYRLAGRGEAAPRPADSD